jgi:DNA polymerase II large subunit
VASHLLLSSHHLQSRRAHQEEENVSDLKDKSWLELCEAASREHDPEKLLELITALNDALEEREQQEKAKRAVTRPREWPSTVCTARVFAA